MCFAKAPGGAMIVGMTPPAARLGLTAEHARVVLAIMRVQTLVRYFEALRSRLTQAVASWVTVSPASEELPSKEIARAWEEEHPEGELEARTRADVESASNGWAAVYGSHTEETVLRMQLLVCLNHAEANGQDWALDDARAIFGLIAPEHSRRLDEEDWSSAFEAWRRKPGRRPKSADGKRVPGKWEMLAEFVKKAGFCATSDESLKDLWEGWKRGGLGPTLFSGLPAANNKLHENSSKQTGRKRTAAREQPKRGPSRRRPSR
jgi:hypothetical protein